MTSLVPFSPFIDEPAEAAMPTFGQTTGGTGTFSYFGNYIRASYASPSSNGKIVKITANVTTGGSLSKVKAALYAYVSSTNVGALLAETSERTLSQSATMTDFTFTTNYEVTAGTNYFIAFMGNRTSVGVEYVTGSQRYCNAPYGTWVDPLNDSATQARTLVAYVTYDRTPSISSVAPTNGSTGIALTPSVNVTFSDIDATSVKVYFAENSTGSWVIRQSNTSTNGTCRWIDTYASTPLTKYWVKVSVNDSYYNVSQWFYFTTGALAWSNHAPVISSVVPANESYSISRYSTSSALISDQDGNTTTVCFWYSLSNSPYSWVKAQQNNSHTANTTCRDMNSSWISSYATEYWFKITAADSFVNTSTGIYHFWSIVDTSGITAYYVSVLGSDTTGAGTLSNPWATIRKATLSASGAGYTVFVREGTYNGLHCDNAGELTEGTSSSWLTLSAFPTADGGYENVVINRTFADGTDTPPSNGYIGMFDFHDAASKKYIYIRGFHFENGTLLDYDESDTPDTCAFGIASWSYNHNFTIEDCYFENISDGAIICSGMEDVIIRNCTLYDVCDAHGKYTPGQEGISIQSGTRRAMVYNNTLSLIPKIMIDVKASSRDVLIYDNLINTTQSTNPNGAAIIVDAQTTFVDNVSIYNNRIWGNHHGVVVSTETGGDASNITIYNNLISSTGTSHLCVYIYSLNLGVGTNLKDNIMVKHNTLYTQSYYPIYIRVWEREIQNCYILDNIIDTNCLKKGIEYYNSTYAGVTVRNNLFNVSSSDVWGYGSVNGTPLFTSPTFSSDSNFTLQAGSYAINKASASFMMFSDFILNKRPHGASFDVGAYEYGSNTSSYLNISAGTFFKLGKYNYTVESATTFDSLYSGLDWISFNGIGFNVTHGGSYLRNNITMIIDDPLTSTGYILNWTQRKDYYATASTEYLISGLKPLHEYTLYSNGSGTAHTTDSDGVLTFYSAIASTYRNYALYDIGIPADWYVATTGSDSNPGTLAFPFLTIQRAINASTTSDDIIIRGGTYNPYTTIYVNRSGTSSDWFTISNYPGETVVINGSSVSTSSYLNSAIQIPGNDYVRITGLTVNRSALGGITIYNSPTESSYIRIDNCTVSNCSSFAIKSNYGDHIYIENNYLYNNFCKWNSVSLSQETISFSNVDYGYIYGNYLWKNHCEQIDMKYGCTWCYCYDNIINTTASTILKTGTSYYSGGIGIYSDSIGGVNANISIYKNLIYGNNTGIQISNEASVGHYENISVYNNIVNITNTTGGKPTANGRIGIIVQRGDSGDNPTDINKDIRVYMNTVNLGANNIYAAFQVGINACQMYKNYIRRLNVSNNIFTRNIPSALGYYEVKIYGLNSTDGSTYIKLNSNLYNNSYAGVNKRIGWRDGDYTISSSTKWGNSPLFTKPLYVSPSTYDFHLNSTSPAKDSAMSSLVSSYDYEGNTRPAYSGYDRGAYEYTGYLTPSFTIQTESPSNTSTGISLMPSLSVSVSEDHGYSFSYEILENTTGSYLPISSDFDTYNTTATATYSNATGYSTKYYWMIVCWRDATYSNETYYFTTITPVEPEWTITVNYPTNASADIPLMPDLNFTVTESHGYGYNMSLWENSTGSWQSIYDYYGGDLTDDTYVFNYFGAVDYDTTYGWKVILWNGTDYHNETFIFSTEEYSIPTDISINDVHANWTTSTSVYLSWTKGANTTNTYLYRSSIGYLIGESVLYSGENSYYNDTGRNQATRYYYTLKAHNSPSAMYGNTINVSLAETENVTSYGSSWVDFKGWLATTHDFQTRFYFSEDAGFTGISLNETAKRAYHDSIAGTTADSNSKIYYTHQRSQSFTLGADDFYLTKITLKLYRPVGYIPGNQYCYIYAADAAHLPTGAILSSGTRSGTDITEGGYTWLNFTMSTYELTAATEYCIVLKNIDGLFNAINWYYDPGHLYVDGKAGVSNDDGSSWSTWDVDFLFQVWGNIPTGSFSALNSDNTTVSSTGLFNITQGSLNPGQLYYYQVRGNDTAGNMTRGNTRMFLSEPDVPVFQSIYPVFANNSVQVSWVTGTGANNTILIYDSSSYVIDVDVGNISYNGSAESVWIENISFNHTYYFTLFSYTVWGGYQAWSTGVPVPWGGLRIMVYNESNPTQSIGFDMIITNSNLEAYYVSDALGPYFINVSSIPYGNDTVFFISNTTSYNSRIYTLDVEQNTFYLLNFYLPYTVEPISSGNLTYTYGVYVYDIYGNPINNALVSIKRYLNGTFEEISSGLTGANGGFNAKLYAGVMYVILLSKDGYQNSTNFLLTSDSVFAITYTMELESSETTVTYDPSEYITFTAVFTDNTTMYVIFVDSSDVTDDGCIFIYESGSTLVYTVNLTGSSYSFNWTGGNHSLYDYKVVLQLYNHSMFGNYSDMVILPKYGSIVWDFGPITFYLPDLSSVILTNPLGWVSSILAFLGIMLLVSFGRAWAGIGIMAVGGLIFVFELVFGLPVLSLSQLSVIPMLLFYGALVQISKSKKETRF